MKVENFKKRIITHHQIFAGQMKGQRQLNDYLDGYKSFIRLKNLEHLTFMGHPVINHQEWENGILSIKEAHQIISKITLDN